MTDQELLDLFAARNEQLDEVPFAHAAELDAAIDAMPGTRQDTVSPLALGVGFSGLMAVGYAGFQAGSLLGWW